uniref:protein-synthesizing GTPase n=1 Tax=Acrobeloides nanus TaxID=290746 RepID=A0A914BV10_9BILA
MAPVPVLGEVVRFVIHKTGLIRNFAAAPAAAKKEKITDKTNFNIGTIGHIDHGKTTLTAAITKVLSKKGHAKYVEFNQIDKAAEEQKRGITINIAHIGYESPQGVRRYAHTDCPGHRDYIKNMICGAAQMDAAILVIAADDGVMEQTKEHILLAKQIGVQNVIVFINKVDKVDQDTVDLVELEARELLAEFGFDSENAPVVKGSALAVLERGESDCIDQLISVMDALPAPPRIEDISFAMPISKGVVIPKKGTVLVGTVETGIAKNGDKLEIQGYGKRHKITVQSMQIFGQRVDMVKSGDHCGIMCKGLDKDDEIRKAEFYLMSKEEGGREKGIQTGFADMIYCGVWNQPAKFFFNNDILMPGEHTSAYLVFRKPVPIKTKSQFVIREQAKREIGYGVITEIFEEKEVNKHLAIKKEILEEMIKTAKPIKEVEWKTKK